MRKIILAIDALEYELVEKFNCKNLKQNFYGKTDISEFSQPRTIVLWASFLTSKNMEKEALALGDEKMWDFKIKKPFFNEKTKVIDMPAYSYEKIHERERLLLKKFFNNEGEDEEEAKKEYNELALKHHEKIKKEFLSCLEKNFSLIIGYFSVIDVIGHLNFGNQLLMRSLYADMDKIAGEAKKHGEVLVISDHGMKAVGNYGNHSNYGFWSFKKELGNPKITDFAEIISNW